MATTQYKNQKMGKIPEQIFFQRRNTDVLMGTGEGVQHH